MRIGDRVRLSGGYDPEPKWLAGGTGYFGRVTRFIPGQNQEPAAVVTLDSPIDIGSAAGKVVVLELRYVGQKWEGSGTVHVELCDFDPDDRPWQDRRQGTWVESHARYDVVQGAAPR